MLELTGLRLAYDRDAAVVDGLDLTVPAGGLTALLGPSGCGKSTVLRAVAGLLDPVAGEIRIDGRSMAAVPAERRPVGLVFQKPLLFGHLSVLDNVAFGLRMRGVDRRERRRHAAEVLDLVELAGMGARRPDQLSGGQEQRVALARALVLDPRVLLLDEPFSALDADLRMRVRELVRRIQRELGVTTLFVTHDQQEAADVADAVAVLFDGRMAAHGPPAELWSCPPTLRVARFLGAVNEIPGRLTGSVFRCALGEVEVASGADGPGVLVIRPESVVVGAGPLSAEVADNRFHGTHRTCELKLPGGVRLVARTGPPAGPAPGAVVQVGLPAADCRVLPPG